MDIRSKMGSSKFFKSSDVADSNVRGTVRCCVEEEIGAVGNRENKMVLYFNEHDKGLVLNVINANTIGDELGFEVDDWPGAKIELYGATTEYNGRMVNCVRCKVISGAVGSSGGEGF